MIAAISEANLARVNADPVLQRKYAELSDGPPPDDLRDPVRTSWVAERLRMPLATVNRRISALVRGDMLIKGAGGVLYPSRHLEVGEEMADSMVQLQTYFLALASRLAGMGVKGEDFVRWSGHEDH